MSGSKDTFTLILIVAVLGGVTWFGGRAYLDWQVQARKEKAAREMQEMRLALEEYNEELKAKQAKSATQEVENSVPPAELP